MKFKSLFILSVLGILNVNAQSDVFNKTSDDYLTIDSGWISNAPSVRSANVFGKDIVNLFDNNRPENKYGKIASYIAEGFFSLQYFTSVHELGHANVAKYYNCTFLIEDSPNWWKNVLTHKLQPVTYYCGKLDKIKFEIAGFNATTKFVEDNPNTNLAFYYLCRLSSLGYICAGKRGEYSDFNSLESLNYNVSKWQFLGAQISTLFLSKLTNAQFYAYLNTNGLSIRGLKSYNGFDIAVESLVNGKYNIELDIGKTFNFHGIKVKTQIVTALHGIGYNIAVEYKSFTIGYRNPNMGTLSGARELNKEFYAQIRF